MRVAVAVGKFDGVVVAVETGVLVDSSLVGDRLAVVVPVAVEVAMLLGFVVLVQVGLGAVSVLSVLAVLPVSLHTLTAAALLAVLVHVATLSHLAGRRQPAEAPTNPALVARA